MMAHMMGELVKKNAFFQMVVVCCALTPFLNVSDPLLSGMRIVSAGLLIFLLPGAALLVFFPRRPSLDSLLAAIVASLIFWTILGFIWIKGQFALNLASLAWVLLIYVGLTLFFGILNWKRHSVPLHEDRSNLPRKIIDNGSDWRRRMKNALTSNLFLFLLFLVLLGLYASIRIPFVPTEDVWFHMAVCNDFLDDGLLTDYDVYRGNLAYHFTWSIFAGFANLDIFLVAKYIGLFQVPLGCLLFYFLLCQFVSNKNLNLILSVFFSLSSMGTFLNFTQFWPTASTIFLGFQLNIIFFKKLKEHQESLISRSSISPLTPDYCLVQGLLAFSIIVLHVTSAIVYLAPILFTLFMLSIRTHKFLKEMIFYVALFALNLLLNPFGLEAATRVDIGFLLVYKYLLIVAIPVAIVMFLYIERFFHHNTYSLQSPTSGGFKPEENSIFKFDDKIYRKYIIPCLVVIGPLVYYFFNSQSKQYLPSNLYAIMLDTVLSALIISAALVGINFFRHYSLVGKGGFYYLVIIVALLAGLLAVNVVYTYFFRILNLYVPFIFIGAGLYLFYHCSHNSSIFTRPKARKVLYAAFIVFLFNSIIYHAQFKEHVTVSKNNFVESTTEFLVEPNGGDQEGKTMIIGNFYYCYIYVYYLGDAPVIYYQYDSHLIRVDNHTAIDENGQEYNVLQALYEKRDLENLFIIIDDEYQTRGIAVLDGVNHGKMDNEEVSQYNNLAYINRVAVAGHGRTIFWVLPLEG